MHEEVLSQVGSEKLAAYVVWEPIMRTDGEVPARRATALVPDPRAHHFWTDSKDVGRAFQRPLGLDGEPAWEAYLLYPPGVEWSAGDAPIPAFFMHQLAGRLPDSLLFDGSALAERTRHVLAMAELESSR